MIEIQYRRGGAAEGAYQYITTRVFISVLGGLSRCFLYINSRLRGGAAEGVSAERAELACNRDTLSASGARPRHLPSATLLTLKRV